MLKVQTDVHSMYIRLKIYCVWYKQQRTMDVKGSNGLIVLIVHTIQRNGSERYKLNFEG